MKYELQTTLDLGGLGERDVTVVYDGYRPIRRAEDDYESVEILHVWLNINGRDADIYDMLVACVQDDLDTQCFDDMPTLEDDAADAADHWYDQRKDERIAA